MFYFVSSRFLIPTHKKEKQPTAPFTEAKLLFFSVLLAFRQRNYHFCGCKGTHNYLYYKTISICFYLCFVTFIFC